MRRAALTVAWSTLLGAALAGCGVKLLPDNAQASAANSCTADIECGPNATCTQGVCFAKSGAIDEVLLEVLPESSSSAGGLSFLSMQQGIQDGSRTRDIDLPKPSLFIGKVPITGEDLQNVPGEKDCPYLPTGKPTIGASIEFSRVGSVGGIPILGLPSMPVTVATTPIGDPVTGGWNAQLSLVPGIYDVYVRPTNAPGCALAPKVFRGAVVTGDIGEKGWAAPATLELPTPKRLRATVRRKASAPTTLVGWQVAVVDPQEERVISTSSELGSTQDPSFATNFEIFYQPIVDYTADNTSGDPSGAVDPSLSNTPLVRISPPAEMADTAPVVYWALSAVDLAGDGVLNLDMSGVPQPETLVEMTGQVLGGPDDVAGVRAKVQFLSTTLDGAEGLTANFNPSVTTDDAGHYAIKLFPGSYRVIAIPNTGTSEALVPPTVDMKPTPSGAGVAQPWAITESLWTIGNASEAHDLVLVPKRIVVGNAMAGTDSAPALGATLQASPSISPSSMGILKRALALSPILPQSASVSVDNQKASFALPLDPGDFDISLRPANTSNFAWWVWPAARITAPDAPGEPVSIDPRLQVPVPLEGTIRDSAGMPLPNAAIRVYARAPMGGATQVGDGRTDDKGRYHLRLPAKFGP